MALRRIFNPTLINQSRQSQPFNWPDGDSIFFQLDDSQFSSADERFKLEMDVSWDGGITWPYVDTNEFQGDIKGRGGVAPSVILDPGIKIVNGVERRRPNKIRFRATPILGTPTVGLFAEVMDDA